MRKTISDADMSRILDAFAEDRLCGCGYRTTLTDYDETTALLVAAGVPLRSIPPDTVLYYLRLGLTPAQIVRDVWKINPDTEDRKGQRGE